MQRRGPSFTERELSAWVKDAERGSKTRPSNSWTEIRYPFATQHLLRERYAHHSSGGVRVERLLEDADSFAADVARRHVKRPGTRMVTAAINSVDWLEGVAQMPINQHLRLVGQVVWTGTSSLLVVVEAHVTSDPSSHTWQSFGSGQFWEIAIDASSAQPVNVPPVIPDTSAERQLFSEAAEIRNLQKARRQQSETKTSDASASSQPLHTMAWAHAQDQNAHGSIYGGHTLLHSFAAAQACAQLHAGSTPVLPIKLVDAAFMQPHQIGTLVRYTAQVSNASVQGANIYTWSHEAWPRTTAADSRPFSRMHWVFKQNTAA
ncbi:hypothetical protein WJX73_003898 [Symbiochloris irregularis]|uniref:HotDog ACOT-type domain-containing protein n=1 Tax=Symbiochloris irregularis TaxID=706552 RepID=A0AAW1PW31_9CHLO